MVITIVFIITLYVVTVVIPIFQMRKLRFRG